jgi:tRNA:m4X modification enzyme
MDNIMNSPSSSCVVAMSKHLCGVATDLSLRALTTTLPMTKLKGIAIALCCHHACHWPDYVNPAFFLNLVRSLLYTTLDANT